MAFEDHATSIFSSRARSKGTFDAVRSAYLAIQGAKYDGIGLRKAVEAVVGKHMLVGELRHPVIVPTVNLTRGMPQVFRTPHHLDFRHDYELKVADVAIATSAAPTYFPIAEIGDELFADGGLYANAPDFLAVHEAEHFLGKGIEDIHVLSVGTTTTQYSLSHEIDRNMGVFGWLGYLPSTIISSQQILSDQILRNRLGNRYFRIDTVQSSFQEQHLGLDVATDNAQKTIRGLALGEVQRIISNKGIHEFMNNVAPKPVFYHGRYAQKS